MKFLKSITDAFGNVFMPHCRSLEQLALKMKDHESLMEDDVRNDDLMAEQLSSAFMPHVSYTSLSPIDQLMAQAIAQARHQMSPSHNPREDIEWTTCINDIVKTIKFADVPEQDPFQHNIESSCDVCGLAPEKESKEVKLIEETGEKQEKNNDDYEALEDGSKEICEHEQEQGSPKVEVQDETYYGSSELETESEEMEGARDADEEDCGLKTDNQTLSIDGMAAGDKYRVQIRQCSEMVLAGWKMDTILVYLKLDRYGYESLFRTTWSWDFSRFPRLLFTLDEQSSFIKALEKNKMQDSHAIRAFDMLCKVGGDVRVLHERGNCASRRPEAHFRKEINSYLKWAWKDAGLTSDIARQKLPVFVFVSYPRLYSSQNQSDKVMLESPQSLENRIIQRLSKIGDQTLHLLRKETSQHEYLIEPPSLFGFAIIDMLVGVFAYEPTTSATRSIGFFDFGNPVTSTEHSIRIALLLNWAKYSMLRVKAALQAADVWVKDHDIERDEGAGYDPDA